MERSPQDKMVRTGETENKRGPAKASGTRVHRFWFPQDGITVYAKDQEEAEKKRLDIIKGRDKE